MAISEVDICNSALIKIGAERIVSLSDSTERARLCKTQYEKLRDDLLRAHPWNFAIGRVELALVADATPAFGFNNSFQIPDDCLRILALECDDDWQREGDKVVTDAATVKIKYVKKITDASKYDSNFCEALACKIAADICYSLVQSASLKDVLLKQADMALRQARSFDAQEGTPGQVVANDWLTIRY